MDVEEIRNAAHRLITDAVQYDESELAPARAKATRYYQGQPFGADGPTEQEGRSSFVLTDLRDTVRAILPSLVRVFFGSEQAVEYQPHGPDDVQTAEQATDFVNRVVMQQDNNGFLEFYACFKDALIRRRGVWKYWWEDQTETRGYQSLVDVQQLELLASDPEIELSTITDSGLSVPGNPMYLVEYRQTRRDGRARFACIPPEEFLVSRNARSQQAATLLAHRTEKTSSELLGMGIPEAVIREHGGLDRRSSEDDQARRGTASTLGNDEPGDWANQKHTYVEAFPYLDVDGDGYAELRKVCCLGPSAYVVNGDGRGEPWDERPFAILIPDPEPHTLEGQGVSDWTMDLQRLGSAVIRSVLDSLALSIFPRTAYVEGHVNVEDVLTTKIGAPIRTDQPPAQVLQEFRHEFTGAQALPILDLVENIRQNRTGISKAAAGLDADALQSSTKAAVAATVTAAQQHIEMIARIFAETGVKDLFRGLLRLLHAYQPKARMVRLRGQFVAIDPKSWDAGMDVTVNVALGAGLAEEKIAVLAGLAQKQELVLQQMGPSNPLFGLGHYRNTIAEMLTLSGRRDIDRFVGNIPTDWQPPPAPQQPDPNMLIAQAEMAKAQAEVAKKQAEMAKAEVELAQKQAMLETEAAKKREELDLRRAEMVLVDDRERDKLDADIRLRAEEINAKYGAQVNVAEIQAAVDRDRARIDADAKVEAAKQTKRVAIDRGEQKA